MSFSLKEYNTFHLDIDADRGIVVNDFAVFSSIFGEKAESFLVIGSGADILFTQPFHGTVLVNRLMGIQFSEDRDNYYVDVQAGEKFDDVIKFCLDRNISGLENLALIPGTAGAAPVQNIGAYGVSFSDFCRYVEALDLKEKKIIKIKAADCGFGYRSSIFSSIEGQKRYIITGIGLILTKNWQPSLKYASLKNIEDKSARGIYLMISQLRNKKLPNPVNFGNAGSFFRNPIVSKEILQKLINEFGPKVPNYLVEGSTDKVKLAAGWLIDKAGLRGYRCGNVGTWPEQALVIVNYGGASSIEITNFAIEIVKTVQERFGVKLENEVRIIGDKGLCQLDV